MTINLQSFNLGKENLELLQYLIKTQDEYDNFKNNFWQGESRQFFSIARYRIHKIEEKNMSLQEFKSLYDKDHDEALSQLFMQPIRASVTNAILNSINNGTLTIERIYSTFVQDKGMNITRIANGRRSINKNK